MLCTCFCLRQVLLYETCSGTKVNYIDICSRFLIQFVILLVWEVMPILKSLAAFRRRQETEGAPSFPLLLVFAHVFFLNGNR